MNLASWDEFSDKNRELATAAKAHAAHLYQEGADKARLDPRLQELCELLRPLPDETLQLIGLTPDFTPAELVVTIFTIGGQMILRLERGGH